MNHEVQEGECLHTIAARYGYLSSTLWNHPGNSRLKSERKGPDSLLAGDIVCIPELRPREEKCPTDHHYVFRKKTNPCFQLESIAEIEEPLLCEAEMQMEDPFYLEPDMEIEELLSFESDMEIEESLFLESDMEISAPEVQDQD